MADPVTVPATSPGFKTTEFITTVITMLIGAAMIYFGVKGNNVDLLENGKWLVLGATGTYAASRGLTKLGGAAGGTSVLTGVLGALMQPAASVPAPAPAPQALPADANAAADVVAKIP